MLQQFAKCSHPFIVPQRSSGLGLDTLAAVLHTRVLEGLGVQAVLEVLQACRADPAAKAALLLLGAAAFSPAVQAKAARHSGPHRRKSFGSARSARAGPA